MKKISENFSYDYTKRIGTGSSGTIVFQGTFDEKSVAVKKIDADNFEMVVREVSLLKLGEQHENIINYFCTEAMEEYHYIALEICHFDSSKYFQQKGDPEPSELLEQLRREFQIKDILRQTTEGVAYLHKIQIIHRDIKPQNILLKKTDDRWKVKISDFGISKLLRYDNTSTIQTLKINPQSWIAPEVLNEKKTSKSSDIYSLGCFFYYMQCGGVFPVKLIENEQGNLEVQWDDLRNTILSHFKNGGMFCDLFEEMVNPDPHLRISADMVLTHGYFWSVQKTLEFLKDLKKMFDSETDQSPAKIKDTLNFEPQTIIGTDWSKSLDEKLVEDIEKKKRYFELDSVSDLITYIQKKNEHSKDSSSDLKDIFGDSSESFLGYWTQKFPFLLMHIFIVCIARYSYFKDKSFRTKYLCFKSLYGKRSIDYVERAHPNKKMLLHSTSNKMKFEGQMMTLKYLMQFLKAFTFSELFFKNVDFEDKTTFNQSNIGTESFSYLKTIIIERSGSFFELLTRTKSIEHISYDMVGATLHDINIFIKLLTQQHRLKTLICTGDVIKLLVEHKFPFQLDRLGLHELNEQFHTQCLIPFMKTQKMLQNLDLSIPVNFSPGNINDLFGLEFHYLKKLVLYLYGDHSNVDFFKCCKINSLTHLKIIAKIPNFNISYLELIMNHFGNLQVFEYRNHNQLCFLRQNRRSEDNKIIDFVDTFWFHIHSIWDIPALDKIKLSPLETCKISFFQLSGSMASFSNFILNNPNIKNFEIHYMNVIIIDEGLSSRFEKLSLRDESIIVLIQHILHGLEEMQTITMKSLLPVTNIKSFQTALEKFKKPSSLTKIEVFESLIDENDMLCFDYNGTLLPRY